MCFKSLLYPIWFALCVYSIVCFCWMFYVCMRCVALLLPFLWTVLLSRVVDFCLDVFKFVCCFYLLDGLCVLWFVLFLFFVNVAVGLIVCFCFGVCVLWFVFYQCWIVVFLLFSCLLFVGCFNVVFLLVWFVVLLFMLSLPLWCVVCCVCAFF